jgi:hypothetical protein
MRKLRNECKILVEKPERKRSRLLGVDERIILKYILKKWDVRKLESTGTEVSSWLFVWGNMVMNPQVPQSSACSVGIDISGER